MQNRFHSRIQKKKMEFSTPGVLHLQTNRPLIGSEIHETEIR